MLTYRKQGRVQRDTLISLHGNPSYSMQDNNTLVPVYETIPPRSTGTRVTEEGGAQDMTTGEEGAASSPGCDCSVAYTVDTALL